MYISMSETAIDRDQLIQRGCSLLSEYIRSEESNPDLATHLRVTSHETCTLSGMEQHDYPPLESPEFSLSGLSHISSLRRQAFPIELIQQLDQVCVVVVVVVVVVIYSLLDPV